MWNLNKKIKEVPVEVKELFIAPMWNLNLLRLTTDLGFMIPFYCTYVEFKLF